MERFTQMTRHVKRAKNTWHVLLALAIVWAGFGQTLAASVAEPTEATLVIDAPVSVAVGEPIMVTLTVKQARGLAGYEAVLRFDPTAAHFSGLQQRSNDLRKLGRDVSPLGAVEVPHGIAFGLYSCPSALCTELPNGAGERTGGNGTIKLATLAIVPDREGTLELAVDATRFVDVDGADLPVQVATPTLTVHVGPSSAGTQLPAPALPAAAARSASLQAGQVGEVDLTGDEQVTHADAMEVAIAWMLAREAGTPCEPSDPSHDINQDGCIDIADVQTVAARYGSARAGHLQSRAQHTARQTTTAPTFTVNSTSDAVDSSIGNGVCATSTGVCTLRAAIAEANRRTGPDRIAFNISGSGVQTIKLGSALPYINDAGGPLSIDGYTQPGATANTAALVSNAKIMVQIEGTGSTFDALFVTSPGNEIRGLAFYNLRRGIALYGSGAANNTIAGNIIGTNVAGTFMFTTTVPGATGVIMQQGAHHNRIGTALAADRNVLSGSAHNGVGLYDEATDYNVIVNNLIGLNPAATARVPNRNHGIDINTHASYTQVGGLNVGERNVVSGNGYEGIEVSHGRGTVENRIVGNFIGTDVTGKTAPAFAHNVHFGLRIEDGVTNNYFVENVIGNNRGGGVEINGAYTWNNRLEYNRIGVSLDGRAIPNGTFGIQITFHAQKSVIGPGNRIANQAVGIRVTGDADNDFHRFTRNQISTTGGLGIDLHPLGTVNLNDTGDQDSGPNDQLNMPVLSGATTTSVTGIACAGCTVEIFLANGGANAYGSGTTFVGSASAGSDGRFSAGVTNVQLNQYVTATATDATGNTSEFALNMLVGGGGGGSTPTTTPTTTPTPTPTAFLPAVFVADQFSRTVVNGWGSAPTGGTYTLTGSSANFDTTGSTGTMELPSAGVARDGLLLQVAAQNVDLTARVQTNKVPTGYGQIAYLLARRGSTNNQYRARMRFASNGSVWLQATKLVAGAETALSGEVQVTGLSHAAGRWMRMRAEVAGSNPTWVRIKAWADGQTEPSAWQYQVTDSEVSVQGTGAVGLRAYISGSSTNAPLIVTWDDFSVKQSSSP